MTALYVVIVSLALAQQVTFSVLYWRWIPAWKKNAYGRLAQFGSWSLSIPLLLALIVFATGHSGDGVSRFVFTIGFLPLIVFGFMQLDLLKKAVDSGGIQPSETHEESEVGNDS